MRKLICLATALVAATGTAAAQQADRRVHILSVREEYNVAIGNERGMRIVVDMEAQGMRGSQLYVLAFFEFENGVDLKDMDGRYSVEGDVATGTKTTAQFDGARGTVELFMPATQLHLGPGFHRLRYYVCVFAAAGPNSPLAFSGYRQFFATMPGEIPPASASLESIPPAYRTPPADIIRAIDPNYHGPFSLGYFPSPNHPQPQNGNYFLSGIIRRD